MKKMIFAVACSVFSLTGFAAGVFPVASSQSASSVSCSATPNYYDADFCSTFPPVAVCQCKETAPAAFCGSAQTAYNTMMEFMKSIHAGCEYAVAHNVIPASDEQNCEYRWSCFENGGSFNGHQCQGTGQACSH